MSVKKLPHQTALGRRLLLSVYAPTFMLSLGEAVLIPTLPLYAQSFGVSLSLVSLAVAATWIGTLVTDLPAGLLLQRMGRRQMTLVGTSALAVSTLVIPLGDQFSLLVGARALAEWAPRCGRFHALRT
jgi:predicted MFS family arabinose efflux permease